MGATMIINKEILGAKVEISLAPQGFDTFELSESIGKIGPYDLSRAAMGHPNYTLRAENGAEMRIDMKEILIKCAEEFHAMIEAKDAGE